VATGSQANVRAAYTCGTPAFGVGAGNVAGIVDETADIDAAADRVLRSPRPSTTPPAARRRTAWCCWRRHASHAGRAAAHAARCCSTRRRSPAAGPDVARRQAVSAVIGQSAEDRAARRPGRCRPGQPRLLLVEEDGFGADRTRTRARSSARCWRSTRRATSTHAMQIVERIYAYQGAGHSVGLHSPADRAMQLGLRLPVSRVIVNQAHSIATGGSFDNGLPFSLSMGCGTWGRNNFSENMNYRHYLNITRISRAHPRARAHRAADLRRLLRQVRAELSMGAAGLPPRTVHALVQKLLAAARPQAVYALATEGDDTLNFARLAASAAGASAACCARTACPPATRCRW
jgi:sulfoacetaldehyde dehydrogenase